MGEKAWPYAQDSLATMVVLMYCRVKNQTNLSPDTGEHANIKLTKY